MINITSYTITIHHDIYGLRIIPRGSIESEVIEALLDKYGEGDEFWSRLQDFESKGPIQTFIDTYIPEEHRNKFESKGGKVFYEGFPIPATFFRRAIRTGQVKRAMCFMDRLKKNPYEDNHFRTFDFLESSNLPLSEDGCILAYKSVRISFYDWYSNSTRYYPGDEPELTDKQVDTNTFNLCSAGLHFCSYGYMAGKFFGEGRSRVVLIKVAPEDIASIPMPSDANAIDSYRNSKGRAFKVKSICALNFFEHMDFVEMNEQLNLADDENLNEIVNRYTDKQIPSVDEVIKDELSSQNTTSNESLSYDCLMDGESFTVATVGVDKNIYHEWIKVKHSITKKVATILSLNENEIIATEAFISQEAPYKRVMAFYYDEEDKTLNFGEQPA